MVCTTTTTTSRKSYPKRQTKKKLTPELLSQPSYSVYDRAHIHNHIRTPRPPTQRLICRQIAWHFLSTRRERTTTWRDRPRQRRRAPGRVREGRLRRGGEADQGEEGVGEDEGEEQIAQARHPRLRRREPGGDPVLKKKPTDKIDRVSQAHRFFRHHAVKTTPLAAWRAYHRG